MSTRREQLLDAAIRVLGERGVRALTHRAVDAEAALPPGSTANHFPTREALFAGVVDRVALREQENFEAAAVQVRPSSTAELARGLARVARDGAGRHRSVTLARYALLVESATNPVLRERMAASGSRVSAFVAGWLQLLGSTDPDRDVHLLGNYLTGLVLHQLAVPDPDFDPTDRLAALLGSLLPLPARPT